MSEVMTDIETVKEALRELPGSMDGAYDVASDALSRIERALSEAIRKREIEGEQWKFALAKAERVVEAARVLTQRNAEWFAVSDARPYVAETAARAANERRKAEGALREALGALDG